MYNIELPAHRGEGESQGQLEHKEGGREEGKSNQRLPSRI